MVRGLPVPLHVAGQLGGPPGGVAAGCCLVLGAAVPEATVDEDGDLGAAEQEVGSPARHAGEGGVDSISKTPPVKLASKEDLGLCVACSLPGHSAGSCDIDGGRGSRGVGHGTSSQGRLVSPTVLTPTPSSDSGPAAAKLKGCKPKITTLDLFAGAGGLSEGLNTAPGKRFKAVRAVEMDHAAAATYALNHGGRLRDDKVVGGPVYAGAIEDWLANEDVPEVDVVIGGPPCQGFSTLNRAGVGAHRNELWRLYAQTVERATPQYFVLENVPAFLKSEQWGVFKEALDGGILNNYEIEFDVLNAADYGAFQARKRVIVIGRHKDLPAVGLPTQTHAGAHRNVAEALLGVPRAVDRIGIPEGDVEFRGLEFPGSFSTRQLHFGRPYTQLSLDRFKSISHDGGSRSELPDHLKAPCWRKHDKGTGDVMGRLSWEKPSVTIRTEFYKPEKGRYIHPDQDRVITHYEAALVQGFRKDYRWVGTRDDIARQIGNAVPIPLGAAIGGLLADAFHQARSLGFAASVS
jgi:DNA (cytosine-5)-methyltransferase 1